MAVLHRETIHLEQNGSRLTAHVVRPESQEPLPGVVLIQEWWGIEPHILDLAQRLAAEGFEIGVHDLRHDGKLFSNRRNFERAAGRINHYLREWKAVGYRSGFMLRNLAVCSVILVLGYLFFMRFSRNFGEEV